MHRLAHPPPYTAAEIAQSQVSHNARLGFVGRRALAAYTAMFVHSSMSTTNEVYAADFLRGKDIAGKLEALRHQNNIGRTVGDRWQIGEVMRWDNNEVSWESCGDIRRHQATTGWAFDPAAVVTRVSFVSRHEPHELSHQATLEAPRPPHAHTALHMHEANAQTGRDGGYAKVKGLTVEAVLGGVFTHLGSPAAQRAYHLHILPLLEAQLRDPALIEAAERVRDSAQGLGGVLP